MHVTLLARRTARLVVPLVATAILALGLVDLPAAQAAPDPGPVPDARNLPAATSVATPFADAPNSGLGKDVDLTKIPAAKPRTRMAPSSVPPQVQPGTPVPHRFDVVVANIYSSPDEFPAGAVSQPISDATITSLMTTAADFWSRETGLVFDFTTGVRTHAINTTCDTVEADALAAYGEDSSAYTGTNRDLLIFESTPCGPYAGLALSVADPASVFTGGIFKAVTNNADDASIDTGVVSYTIAHEFGHTIGLLHSNVLECAYQKLPGADRIGPLWDGTYLNLADCDSHEYGDRDTVMGEDKYGLDQSSLSVVQRWLLGVAWDGHGARVVSDPVDDLTVTLARTDKPDASLPAGVVIPQSDVETFAVEYGPGDPEDPASNGVFLTSMTTSTFLDGQQMYGGYTQRLLPEGVAVGDNALDAAGADIPTKVNHQPLRPGDRYVSADGRLSVTTVSVSDASATVRIHMGSTPGVRGAVSISRNGATLTAGLDRLAPKTAVATYQWFRDGQAIPGATGATYVVPAADMGAVHRVEATLTADGYATVVRQSRGILPDDRRFVINGSQATFTFVDQNGVPLSCYGLMALRATTTAGRLITDFDGFMFTTSDTGVCVADLSPGVTGTFAITTRFTMNRLLAPYWEPLSAPMTATATGASAVMLVGLEQPNAWVNGVRRYLTGIDGTPLSVTVAVTDDTGAPATNVPVTLSVPDGFVLTPANPVTDSDGLAFATVAWDRNRLGPVMCDQYTIEASVPGVAVTGSPVPFEACSGSAGAGVYLSAWVDDRRTAAADGVDTVVAHVKVWDENGQPVVDHPELLGAGTQGVDVPEIPPHDPQWNAADQDYTFEFRSTSPTVFRAFIVYWPAGQAVVPWPQITFLPADVASILGSGFGGVAVGPDGVCDDGTDPVAKVQAQLLSAGGTVIGRPDLGVTFSLPEGSPLTFVSDPVVAGPDASGGWRYEVRVTSPVAGTFDVLATTSDGSAVGSIPVTISDGAIDPANSHLQVTTGTRQATGKDPHQATVDLRSVCHAPMTDLGASRLSLALHVADAATGQPSSAITTTDFQPDATPGSYVADIFSTAAGTYDVSAELASDFGSPIVENEVGPTVQIGVVRQVRFVAALSSDAALASLTVSAGTLSPAFDPAVTAYAVSVPYAVGSVSIGATTHDPGATLAGAGDHVLAVGANDIVVRVTAPDGTTSDTVVTVTRAAASADSALASLSVSPGTLSPAFDPSVHAYTVSVPYAVDAVTVGAAARSPVASVAGTGDHPLSVGDNPIAVTVTAQDGTSSVYTVTVVRATPPKSADSALASLSLSQGTLSPAFDPAVTAYTASVGNQVSSVTVTATAHDAAATVSGAGDRALAVGPNALTVTVTAEDGTSTQYVVTLTRAAPPSADSALASLAVSPGTLVPAFDPTVTAYSVGVPHSVASVTVSASAHDPSATVSGTGAKPLAVGANVVTVTVTAQDGSSTSYVVTLTRAKSSDSALSGLTLSAGVLTPAFDPAVTKYTASVPNTVESIAIAGTAHDPAATVTGGGTYPLAVGDTTLTVRVTAPDGTTTDYEVTLTRAAATPVAPGISGPSSLALVYGYAPASSAPFEVTGTAPVTVTKTSGDAAITWNPGTASVAVAAGLHPGTYPVTLTASNGVAPDATTTLTVTVTPLPVTVTADDQSKYVGAPDPTLTWTVKPALLAGDTLTGSLTYTGSAPGSYPIVQDVPFANPDYRVTFVPGTMTILTPPSVQAVIDAIDGLRDPVTTWADADLVAQAANMLAALTPQAKALVPQAILDKLAKAEQQAGPVNRVDAQAGASVTGGAALGWQVRLVVLPVAKSDARWTQVAGKLSGQSLLALDDVRLVDTLTGEPVQPPSGQTVTVRLTNVPIGKAMNVGVVHANPDGTLTAVPATVSGQTVTFDGASFSLYGVAGTLPGGGTGGGGKLVPTGGSAVIPGAPGLAGAVSILAALVCAALWRRRAA